MITVVIILSCVTFFSLLVTAIALYSAFKANEANSIIAKQFVEIVANGSDRTDFIKDGQHVATSFSFPNSEGL